MDSSKDAGMEIEGLVDLPTRISISELSPKRMRREEDEAPVAETGGAMYDAIAQAMALHMGRLQQGLSAQLNEAQLAQAAEVAQQFRLVHDRLGALSVEQEKTKATANGVLGEVREALLWVGDAQRQSQRQLSEHERVIVEQERVVAQVAGEARRAAAASASAPVGGGSHYPEDRRAGEPPVIWTTSGRAPEMRADVSPPKRAGSGANLHKVGAPPEFKAERYEAWKKEVMFRRDLYWAYEDAQLLSVLGLHATTELKDIIMAFMQDTRDLPSSRTFACLMGVLDQQFAALAEERRVAMEEAFVNFRKKSSWDFRKFWFRFDRMRNALRAADVSYSDDVLFTRALRALCLSQEHRYLVLSAIESQPGGRTVNKLKEVTVRLFSNYDEKGGLSIYQARKVNPTEGDAADSEDAEESDSALAASQPKGRKAKNRAGHETTAVRAAANVFNLPNQFGKGGGAREKLSGEKNPMGWRCLRCGAVDHLWRSCPMPFQKELLYGNAGKTKGAGRRVLLGEEAGKGPIACESAPTDEAVNNVEDVVAVEQGGLQVAENPDEAEHDCWDEWEYTWAVECDAVCSVGGLPSASQEFVIDSGATSTVCGRQWLEKWDGGAMGRLCESKKRFRFGDSRAFRSLGSVMVAGVIQLEGPTKGAEKYIEVATEVVDAEIPMLLSAQSLTRMRAVLSFGDRMLTWGKGNSAKLGLNSSGHLVVPLKQTELLRKGVASAASGTAWESRAFVGEVAAESPAEAAGPQRLTIAEVDRLRVHTGHSTAYAMQKMISASGRSVSSDVLASVISRCGCAGSRPQAVAPKVNIHVVPAPGHTVYGDVYYPREGTAQRFPYVVFADGFSRFTVSCPAPSLKPEGIISLFERQWVGIFGRPRRLILDGGPGVSGKAWESFCHAWDITLVINPTDTPSQMGMVERTVGLLKAGARAICAKQPGIKFESAVRYAAIGRNLTPLMSTGLSPHCIMMGKSNLLATLEEGQFRDGVSAHLPDLHYQDHVRAIAEARAVITRADADRTIKWALQHKARPMAREIPLINDDVKIIVAGKWDCGWRFVGAIHSNCVVERGNALRKVPLTHVKKTAVGSTEPEAHDGAQADVGNDPSLEEALFARRSVANHPVFSPWANALAEDRCLAGEADQRNDEEDFNPSRLPPRLYLGISAAVDAIRKELDGLTSPDGQGVPALVSVRLGDEAVCGLPIVRSTLVVKMKSPTTYKARLCVRGDTVSLVKQAFASSPTAHRASLKIVVALSVISHLTLHTLDVSQAFLQSGCVAQADRVLIIPPDCVGMPWAPGKGVVDTTRARVGHPRFAFAMLKPLYGLREAPLKWFISLCSTLRAAGFHQLRSDVCLFNWIRDGRLEALLLIHVDDIIIGATEAGIARFTRAMERCQVGELATVRSEQMVIFLGMDIMLSADGDVLLSQNSFIDRLRELAVADFVADSKVLHPPEKIRTVYRRMLGSLIWLHQTRYDVAYWVTHLATTAPYAVLKADDVRKTLTAFNKVIRHPKSRRVSISYTKIWPASPRPTCEKMLNSLQLYGFSDAGYATLLHEKSIESSIIVLGITAERDGVILCKGMPLDFSARKVSRTVRSTIACEVVALTNMVDLGLWFQLLLAEVLTCKVWDARILETEPYPLANPFRLEPAGELVRRDISDMRAEPTVGAVATASGEIRAHGSDGRAPGEQECSAVLTTFCKRCSVHRLLPLELVEKLFYANFNAESLRGVSHPEYRPASEMPPLKFIALTDCANAYAAVLSMQPRSNDKLTRILLSFLRDLSARVYLSFCDAMYNLGDAGTKADGNAHLFYLLREKNVFRISFLGRRNIKLMKIKP